MSVYVCVCVLYACVQRPVFCGYLTLFVPSWRSLSFFFPVLVCLCCAPMPPPLLCVCLSVHNLAPHEEQHSLSPSRSRSQSSESAGAQRRPVCVVFLCIRPRAQAYTTMLHKVQNESVRSRGHPILSFLYLPDFLICNRVCVGGG